MTILTDTFLKLLVTLATGSLVAKYFERKIIETQVVQKIEKHSLVFSTPRVFHFTN